ncbi:MAG: peptide deformylase [Clostridia bacterium]|nr:peptide deformylase [Clostridia bacterium]
MALREIRILGDELLRKKSREVTEINDKIRETLSDMQETMLKNDGVGIAAPQIGILKRMIVVMKTEKEILKLINPEIVEMSGEAVDYEGCLSVKKKSVKVKRPTKIKVRAQDEYGNKLEFVAEDFFARVICHEVDHLEGILIVDKEV